MNFVRLHCETLENRETPAAFILSSVLDTSDAVPGDGTAADAQGNVTLRAIIEEANAAGNNHTVSTNVPLNSTIQLSKQLPDINTNISFGHTPNAPLIEGQPAQPDWLTIRRNAAQNFYIIGVNKDKVVSFGKFAFTNGNSVTGGGLSTSGNLSLSGCKIYDNVSTTSGGGIHSEGSLSLISCEIYNNKAETHGGGVRTSALNPLQINIFFTNNIRYCDIHDNKSTKGGGIAHYADQNKGEITLDITESKIRNNKTQNGALFNDAGGGGIYISCTSNNSSIKIWSTEITGNTTGEYGGGILMANGQLELFSCKVNDNTAGKKGGGVYIEAGKFGIDVNSQLKGNTATNGCAGGGYKAGSIIVNNLNPPPANQTIDED